jgi:alpha-L-fucosidase
MNWHQNRSDIVEFMADNYPPKFTYQDFGPLLTMEFFNASWFADVISDSGAK